MGFGVYIHWPFCLAKCPYCDFNSHVTDAVNHDNWRSALVREVEYYSDKIADKQEVSSIFFGGGTPSLMEPETVNSVINAVKNNWSVANDVEITMEANPTSVESGKFSEFAGAGINRVSVGVQSLRDKDLKYLGREHSAKEAVNALDIARKYFSRTSFDLIYARPDQSLDDWKFELSEALAIAQGHMSLYQLTIEKGTAFYKLYKRGDLKIPSDEEGRILYEATEELMSIHGYNSYEVSNYAKQGHEAQHNLVYWRYDDYLGIGPGAHGRITIDGNKYATRAHRSPDIWQERVFEKGSGSHEDVLLSGRERVEESVLMGLRLFEPLNFSRLEKEYDGFKSMFDWNEVANMQDLGFLSKVKDAFQITNKGRICLESVLPRLFL